MGERAAMKRIRTIREDEAAGEGLREFVKLVGEVCDGKRGEVPLQGEGEV